MTLQSNEDQGRVDMEQPITISAFPQFSQLQTMEQRRGFELLRLAFFALKLRKLERARKPAASSTLNDYEYHCSLLRHVIFQQVLALSALDAREQALQLIGACRLTSQ